MGVGGQRHAPAALPPGRRPGTYCIGGWMGPRISLEGCGQSHPPAGFDPRTVQPVSESLYRRRYIWNVRGQVSVSSPGVSFRNQTTVGYAAHSRGLAPEIIMFPRLK